jgi:hypothetical protein
VRGNSPKLSWSSGGRLERVVMAGLPLHGSSSLGGFSVGRFMPGSAQTKSSCSRSAQQDLDGAKEAASQCGGNGA